MIDDTKAMELAIKYKAEFPQTFHSVKYIAKKIKQHQTYDWFRADAPQFYPKQ